MLRAEAYLPHLNQEYYSDFDKIYPWSEIGRYLVNKDTKAIKCKLDFNNSNREAITMRAIDWAAEEATSDVDVIIPIFAIKIWFDDTNRKHIQVQRSNPILSGLNDGFEIHPAFVRADGSLRDRIHIAAFEGCYIGNQIRSFPNKELKRFMNLDTSRLYARNGRTIESNLQTLQTISVIQILYLVEYASLNSQSKLGKGFQFGVDPYAPEKSGTTLALGDRSGCIGDNRPMSYRGIENVYGNKWERLDGIIIGADGFYIGNDPVFFGDKSKYKFIPETIEVDSSTLGSKRGLITKMYSSADLAPYFLPKEVLVGGDYNTRYSDANFVRTSTDDCGILYGGSNIDGTICGIFTQGQYANSMTSDNSIVRLTYLP